MSVDPNISLHTIKEEIAAMQSPASFFNWQVELNEENLTVTVRMKSSKDTEEFILEAKCDSYKALPPLFEFIHPNTSEKGNKSCYPSGSNYFHSKPCICVEWNRKAYKEHGGPHGDWEMTNWQTYRPSTKTLGDMFIKVQTLINDESYTGRMA